MHKLRISLKPPVWFMVLVMAALAAGCGGGSGGTDGGAQPTTTAGAGEGLGAGHGPAPLHLGTAANFVILTVNALTNQPPSVITGNVGLTKVSGSQIGLTCAEVSGQIVSIDTVATSNTAATSGSKKPKRPGGSGGTGSVADASCYVTDAAGLNQGELDADDAFNDASARTADYNELSNGNIGGLNLGPATYSWSTAISIATNLTLTGGPNDVWIFRAQQGLLVSPGVQIILKGGALPQNVFWAPRAQVELGTGAQFKGILLPAAAVFMGTGVSLNGKVLAAEVHLNQSTVGP
ncbi:MAG: ice-binding family protein [Betaproteobacteria bacterium]